MRRNSPSVMLCRPTSCWNLTISAMALSSTLRSCAAVISPRAFCSRASSRNFGRRKLPTWSARNGGVVRAVIGISPLGFNGRPTPSQASSGVGSASSASLRAAVSDAAAVEHDGVVGHAEHHVRMLLDDDRRQPFLARDAADRAQQFLDDDRRQPFERLVEQQQLRVEHQRARRRRASAARRPRAGCRGCACVRPGAGTARRRASRVHAPGPRDGGEVLVAR